jgi:hypothetical protein
MEKARAVLKQWRYRPLIVICAAIAVGAALGFFWARHLIDREHLSPTDAYIPVIYAKFSAAWAAGFGFVGLVIAYLIEFFLGTGANRPSNKR